MTPLFVHGLFAAWGVTGFAVALFAVGCLGSWLRVRASIVQPTWTRKATLNVLLGGLVSVLYQPLLALATSLAKRYAGIDLPDPNPLQDLIIVFLAAYFADHIVALMLARFGKGPLAPMVAALHQPPPLNTGGKL
jgi:hypothetical protein